MKIKETKDHYVARTYLRRFQDASNKLYVCNKEKAEYFSSCPSDVCFERGWDLMKDSSDVFWLKKILEDVEPKLSAAMTRLADNDSTFEDKFVISTYLAILQTFNPENFKTMKAFLEGQAQLIFQQSVDNGQIKIPEEFLKKGITTKDINVVADPEVTRMEMANMLNEITFHLYTSRWAIIKNKTELDFFTSDNPFYFLALPVENTDFAKYIALDPRNILLVFPPERTSISQINVKNVEFTDRNEGPNIYLNAKKENEIALFNTYTIGNANRFIIMSRECGKLKKLISDNIKTSTMQTTQILGNLHLTTTQSSRTPEQQEADMKIFFQLFDKSRQI